MNIKTIAAGYGLFVTVTLVLGCASEQVKSADSPKTLNQIVEEGKGPKWLTMKGPAFSGDRAVFYGVGNAAGVINPSLKRKAAESAARRDIAQEFSTYIAVLQKQYQAETTAGSLDRHSVEQHIEDVMKQLTEQTLVGSSIVEYWENPYRNEAYALARLDLARFKDMVEAMNSANSEFKELDAAMREFVRKNAEKLHGELAGELQNKQKAEGK